MLYLRIDQHARQITISLQTTVGGVEELRAKVQRALKSGGRRE